MDITIQFKKFSEINLQFNKFSEGEGEGKGEGKLQKYYYCTPFNP